MEQPKAKSRLSLLYYLGEDLLSSLPQNQSNDLVGDSTGIIPDQGIKCAWIYIILNDLPRIRVLSPDRYKLLSDMSPHLLVCQPRRFASHVHENVRGNRDADQCDWLNTIAGAWSVLSAVIPEASCALSISGRVTRDVTQHHKSSACWKSARPAVCDCKAGLLCLNKM